MDILATLRTVIAPELNHLYTVRPYAQSGEGDCGWSCREHALHVHTICSALGVPSQLCLGEFQMVSLVPAPQVVESGSTGNGHAWCRVKGTTPVDLSMTFKFYWNDGPQLLKPVLGTGRNGSFHILYGKRNEEPPAGPDHPHVIAFMEFAAPALAASDLVRDPYLFLHPAPSGNRSWHALFGPQIYAKISLHCFRLARGEASSLDRLSQAAAVRRIADEYHADATNELLSLLSDSEKS